MEKLKDIAWIFGTYAIYAALTVFVYGSDRFTGEALPVWPIMMLGISLSCMLLWYVAGEFVIRPDSPKSVFYTVWALLLAAIVAAAVWVILKEAKEVALSTDMVAHPWFLFLGGTGFYYLASVLRSPTFAKALIWPASRFRK